MLGGLIDLPECIAKDVCVDAIAWDAGIRPTRLLIGSDSVIFNPGREDMHVSLLASKRGIETMKATYTDGVVPVKIGAVRCSLKMLGVTPRDDVHVQISSTLLLGG